LAPAPLFVKPDAKQLARLVIVRSQHRHHRSSGSEDHLVAGLRFLSAHKPPLLSNLQIRVLAAEGCPKALRLCTPLRLNLSII
jgi:hypothetical protein